MSRCLEHLQHLCELLLQLHTAFDIERLTRPRHARQRDLCRHWKTMPGLTEFVRHGGRTHDLEKLAIAARVRDDDADSAEYRGGMRHDGLAHLVCGGRLR